MSFDWGDYVTLAHALQETPESPGPREASLRSAISRAYYGVHCAARNLLRGRREFEPTLTGEDHRRVIDALLRCDDLKRRKLGVDLNRLLTNRGRADYDDEVTNLERTAHASVDTARHAVDALNSL